MTNSCFHCGEPVPADAPLTATIGGELRTLCCEGCRAAALLIDGAGLGQFYAIREQLSPTSINDEDGLGAVDLEAVQAEFVRCDGQEREAELVVEGMRCSACAWLLEHLLSQQPGVVQAVVNLAAQRLLLRWRAPDVALSTLLRLIQQLGYRAVPFMPQQEERQYRRETQTLFIQLGVAAIASMQVMMVAIGLWFGAFSGMDADFEHYLRWVSLMFAAPVVFYAALPFHIGALRGLLSARPGMDLPVSLALLLAFGASAIATVKGQGEVFFESVSMFVFFLLIGRLLEHRSRRQATEHTANLRRSMPLMARRLTDDGQISEVAVASLQVGQRVLVAPGNVIPADGHIEQGLGEVDESMLTGESLPVAKMAGDEVFAGTLNTLSPLEIRVSRQRADSVLATIIRHQTLALAERPKWALLADQIASYFVVSQLLLTALCYLVWHTWIDQQRAFEVALSLLVATCPCALALATPAALSSAIARLGQFGVLMRRSSALEAFSKVTTVVFDKTGTLTYGKLELVGVTPLAAVDADQVLAIARALEQNSEHPVARALGHDDGQPLTVSERSNHPGRGVSGVIAGRHYALGRNDWYPNPLPAPAEQGNEVVVTLYAEQKPIAQLSFADKLREEAPSLCSVLRQNRLTLLVASGDPGVGAARVLEPLPLTERHLGLTPEGKQTLIKALQARGEQVMVVGDGINDAPILAQADCSLAMGGGTDLAKQSADAVLVANRLDTLPLLLRLSRAATTTAKQNLGWALIYNLVVVPMAMAGWITPYFAALGMSASSVVVLVNASRLLRFS